MTPPAFCTSVSYTQKLMMNANWFWKIKELKTMSQSFAVYKQVVVICL